MSDDEDHMRAALALARRGLGQCWPNPAVGCVVVKDGRVVGRAVTAPGGRPHAEPQALAMAGAAARGATAYVTLEPCSHHGRTPPCTEALIEAGVARVVVGATDPDPRVNGSGLARLREAGIPVEAGVLQQEALDFTEGFISRVSRGRPMVTLKLATTLDGRIATEAGESRWITHAPARRAVHALRATHDAVMVGIGTVLADDPDLTCRLQGARATPIVRIVVDSHLRAHPRLRLVATARETPTWILTTAVASPALQATGVMIMTVASDAGRVDLAQALQALGAGGLTRVLVEGGAAVAASLLRADLVDRLVWFHAPGVMGADGWPAAQALGLANLSAMPHFERVTSRPTGPDMMTELKRAA